MKPDVASCALPPAVSTQPTKKRKRDADNADRVRREDDEENDDTFDPGDESDFELDLDSEENIGLDTATGFDDPGDDDELLGDEGDEDEHWSTDSEEAGDLPGAEADMPGEEYGWLGDDEPADDDESFDAELGDDEDETRDDGGAEGLEDDSELDDLNLSELPELDADAEEEAGQAPGEGFDELGGLALLDEPSIEIGPGEVWKLLPSNAVRVTRITGATGVANALTVQGSTLFLASDALYRLTSGRDALERLPLSPAQPSTLAIADHEGQPALAVVAGGRVYVSRDLGESFSALDTPGVTQLGYTHSVGGLRLWWRTSRSALGGDWLKGSPLPPELESEVLGFSADGKRSVAVLCRLKGRLQLIYSGDAGKRFARHAVPAFAGEPGVTLQVCAGAVLLTNGEEVRCTWLPENFEPVAAQVRAPAALSDEEDEPFIYACVRRSDEWLVIRRSARVTRSAPLVLAALDKTLFGEQHMPLQLAVGYTEGGAVTVYVAGRDALVQIEASLDSEELA
ncbi:MAG: hypothetical protein ABW321_11045 [Polyangiales bacterium]